MLGMNKGRKSIGVADVETLVGPRATVRGDVSFSGGLYVEGRILGAICAEEGSDAVVTIAEQGGVEGEVRAPVIIVNGHVTGDLYAGERVVLGPGARVEGNIHYKVVEMAAGAMISGRLIHGQEPMKQLSGPQRIAEA
jgi:cytoskeletal protein CcmA (bactofilin family)